MTFLQSAKYVGYGFFGMMLFGTIINKAFADGGEVSGYCYVTQDRGVMICGPDDNPENTTTYCLSLNGDGDVNGTLFICTKDKEAFKAARRLAKEALNADTSNQHKDRSVKTPHKPSYSF